MKTLEEAKEYIYRFTLKFAKDNFDIVPKVRFTNNLRRMGTCNYGKEIIYYSIPFIEVNKDCDKALEALAIHECCHFKYDGHRNDFKLLCKSFGVNNVHCTKLDYVKSPEPKKYYLFKCPKCGDIIKRLKMMKMVGACVKCCTNHNYGDWHKDYRYRLVGWVDETKEA